MKSLANSRTTILLLALLSLPALSGCFGKKSDDYPYASTPDLPASTTSVGEGSRGAIIVGVYSDQVTRQGCAMSDWRVSFTTHYSRANGTFVYDTKDAQEYSARNDSALLAKLNETMRNETPVYLSWTTVSDPGCQYEHPNVVTAMTPLSNESGQA